MENFEIKKRFMKDRVKGQSFRAFVTQEIENNSTINIKDCWIKLDKGCIGYRRLSISVEEREDHREGGRMVPSGIFKKFKKRFYVQGTYKLFFIFFVEKLQEWYNKEGKNYTHIYPLPPKEPTVKGAYLSLEHDAPTTAWELCVASFDYRGNMQTI